MSTSNRNSTIPKIYRTRSQNHQNKNGKERSLFEVLLASIAASSQENPGHGFTNLHQYDSDPRNNLYRVQDKLGIKTKQELVIWAVWDGLLDDVVVGDDQLPPEA